MPPLTSVESLSIGQLAAYNAADIDAFCSYYHDDIEVFDAFGVCSLRGINAFRSRYGEMFAAHSDICAAVDQRMVLGPHVVERETWSRISKATGEHSSGIVLVRYTEQDGKIRVAEFLRP